MMQAQKKGKEPKFDLAIIGLISITGLIVLAIVTNWTIYKNMQISQQIKNEKFAHLMVIENISRLTETASFLIDNSASSGTNLGLVEAERYKSGLLSAVTAAGQRENHPQKIDALNNIQLLIEEMYSSGRKWVEAVINVELAAIAPAFEIFNKKNRTLKDLIARVQESTQADLKNTLTHNISISKKAMFISILISLVTIPLILMLQIRISVDNTKLYQNLQGTIDLQNESIDTIEQQNKALTEEIEQRHQVEQKLQSSERFMAQIIDFLPDPTFVIDTEGKVTAWNRAIEELTGIKAQDILGKGNNEYTIPFWGHRRSALIDLVLHWDDKMARTYEYVERRGNYLVSECAMTLQNGKSVNLWNSAQPLYDADGHITGAVEVIHDITDRVQAGKTLKENEELLKLYLEYTPAATAMCDHQMRYLAYSHRWITDYHLPETNLIGQCHYDVFQTIPDHWKQQHQRCFKGEIIAGKEEPFKRADGSVDWVRRNLHPWLTKEGEIGGLIMFTEVITHKKLAEKKLMESENRLHAIGENLPGGMIYQVRTGIDGSRQFTYVSGGVEKLYGYTPDQVMADPALLYQNIDEKDIERVRLAEEEAIKTMETFDVVTRMHLKPGEHRWHRLVSQPKLLKNGDVVFDGIDLDITELKQAEEESRKRRQFLESVLSHVQDAIITLDARHHVVEWNPGAKKMFGYTPDEAIGNELDELVSHGEAYTEARKNTRQVLSGQRLESLEAVRYRKDRTPVHVIAAGSPIIVDGTLENVVAVYTDITQLKVAEKEIQRRADMLRRIIDIVPSMIFVKNAEGRFLMANKAVADSYGTTVEKITGQLHEKFHPNSEQVRTMLTDDRRAIKTGKTIHIPEEPYQDDNGETRWLKTIKVPCPASEFGEPAIVGLGTDITERIRTDRELKQLRNYLTNIIDSMPSVLVGVDTEGRVTQWNRQAQKATGIGPKAAQGRRLEHLLPRLQMEMEKVRTAIEKRKVQREPKKPRTETGSVFYEDVTIYPLVANGVEGAVIRIDDITERVRLEEMIIQSEKMLSIGGLAAGMAHEINNPLAGMMQTASVMTDRLTKDLPLNDRAAEASGTTMTAIKAYMETRGIPRMLTTIIESGLRTAEIVDNMLSFSRKSDSMVSSHNVTDLLERTVELAATDYDLKKQYDFKKIQITREYDDNLPLVPCEKQKIQQVFLNILRNSAEAMQSAPIKGQQRLILRSAAESEMVRIEIEDNGPGMDETTRRRVLEPFFTTKLSGVGTGLGLSVSYFIITENHGGTMTVDSTPGKGTCFVIRLPRKRKTNA